MIRGDLAEDVWIINERTEEVDCMNGRELVWCEHRAIIWRVEA